MSIMVNYARLALECGVNILKGQPLVITGPIWTADFAHLLMEEAYKLGAKTMPSGSGQWAMPPANTPSSHISRCRSVPNPFLR